jgi:hypothetical protein
MSYNCGSLILVMVAVVAALVSCRYCSWDTRLAAIFVAGCVARGDGGVGGV